MSPAASAIVRTYNSAVTVEAALRSLRAQSVDVEVVVVDSGSSDETLRLAAPYADRMVRLPKERFTFGRALNEGAAQASAPVHLALSSHCVMPTDDWVRTAVAHLSDGRNVAACGLDVDGQSRSISTPFVADHDYLLRNRHWGLSNHAGAWRADVWQRYSFDEGLTASEDKEWSWRATADGGRLVIDPRLIVLGSHRRAAGTRAYYRRLVREFGATKHLAPLPEYTVAQALGDWVRSQPSEPTSGGTRRWGRTRLLHVAARWQSGRGATG